MNINYREVLRRIVKYFIVTLLVAYAALNIISSKVPRLEAIYLGLSASTIFAVLDMVSPTIYIKS